jgi:diguanylate cyclase (GGDEF)-like protein
LKGTTEEKGSILVVDDEQSILEMLEAALSFLEYRCVVVNNGPAALELVREIPFDIMLTDVSMPGMKGFELTEEAKRIRPALLVIIMTGFPNDFSYDAAIEAGASDFIKKPFTVKELEVRIDHVRMQDKVRMMSITDELTGLLNRRGSFALAEQAIRRADRSGKGFFLLYADVDGLKEINDTLGHVEGDRALIETARILRATYRKSDIIARIGGDEFVVIAMEADKNDAEAVTERFQAGVDHYNQESRGAFELSVSVGISCYDPAEARSIDTLLTEAEQMMYEQKRLKQTSGRSNYRAQLCSVAETLNPATWEAK